MRRRLIAAFFPLLLALPSTAQEPHKPLPNAEEVVKKVIAREEQADKREEAKPGYLFAQRSIEEKLDKSGAVTERNDRLYQATLIDGHIYLKPVEKNGKPLTGEDAKKEEEREKKFRERIKKPLTQKKDDDDIRLNEELVSRYQFHVIGRERVNDREAFVLTFLPRTNVKLPEKRRMDKILNRLEGKVWVDTEAFALLKVDMHLTEPTSLAGGLGSVRSLDFLIELFAVDPDTFVPKEVRVAFEGRKLFTGMHVKQTATYSDYRKIENSVAKKD
ncbi:MAG: hypothetical protein HYX26_10705 [Acidobacteriales bacterium]|nr:hypothetical protein [Terriglobales bacterium]